jgi:hypothetical protein
MTFTMPSKGYKQTAAHRQAISRTKKGVRLTAAHRRAIIKSRIGIHYRAPRAKYTHAQIKRLLAHLPFSLSPPLSPERGTQCLAELDTCRSYLGKCKILRTYFTFPNAN